MADAVPTTETTDVPLTDESTEGRERSNTMLHDFSDRLGGDIRVLFFASAWLLAAAAVECGDGECSSEEGYAVAVGVISVFVTGVYLGLLMKQPEVLPEKTLEFMAIFLLIWWTVGMIVLTFDGPFTGLGTVNGYFGTWVGFIFAVKLAADNIQRVSSVTGQLAGKATKDKAGATFGLLAAASVALASVIIDHDLGFARNAWILVCTIISILMTLLIMFAADKIGTKMALFTKFIVVWWIAGAAVGTFMVFKEAGNGYFSCICALLCALYLAVEYKESAAAPPAAAEEGVGPVV